MCLLFFQYESVHTFLYWCHLIKLQQNSWVNKWITFTATGNASLSIPVDSIQNVFRPEARGCKIRLYITLHSFSRVHVTLCFVFSTCSVNTCFHFPHLVSFSLRTVRNLTLNTAACNRLHAFAWSVRVGCWISVCNVRVILARKLDVFIHLVRYCCCLHMLDCRKYSPPRATWYPGLNFILTFSPGRNDR